MIEEMKKRAEQAGVKCTEYLPRIAKAREKMKIGIDVCPCKANDKTKFCISENCLKEIMEKGTCCCKAYRKIDT